MTASFKHALDLLGRTFDPNRRADVTAAGEFVASHGPLAEGHASRPMKNNPTGGRNRDTPFVI
jgi:hypothetical protein